MVFIHSKLYSHLFFLGGDQLVAVYSTLLAAKKGKKYIKAQGREKGYGILRKKTNLSLNTLKKYVPQLINLGLVEFTPKGIFMRGKNKIKKDYTRNKHVPIKIGENFHKTQLYSFFVRVKSMEQQQKNQIDKKSSRLNIIARVENRQFLNRSQWKQLQAMYKEGIFSSKNFDGYTDKVILSNMGFCKLKCGEENNSSKGSYYKRRLKTKGFIRTRRRKELICKASRETFNEMRKLDRSLSYYLGSVYKELTAEFSTTEIQVEQKPLPVKPKGQIGRPLEHLQFDFLHYLRNS